MRAEVVVDDGFCVHADATGLLSWLQSLPPAPKTSYIVGGDSPCSGSLGEGRGRLRRHGAPAQLAGQSRRTDDRLPHPTHQPAISRSRVTSLATTLAPAAPITIL